MATRSSENCSTPVPSAPRAALRKSANSPLARQAVSPPESQEQPALPAAEQEPLASAQLVAQHSSALALPLSAPRERPAYRADPSKIGGTRAVVSQN